jgi:hypothetical protein
MDEGGIQGDSAVKEFSDDGVGTIVADNVPEIDPPGLAGIVLRNHCAH